MAVGIRDWGLGIRESRARTKAKSAKIVTTDF